MIAIHAITQHGLKQALRLAEQCPEAILFASSKLAQIPSQAQTFDLPLAEHLARQFAHYEQHICFFSIGIATRLLAPLLQDKRQDPGVICVDEQAQYVVPVLSGHRGGANAMALRVAHLLRATPVLTTASDASGTLSVDLLGAPFGWTLDPRSEAAITPVAAAIVNEQPVLIIQLAGEKTWWPHERDMPAHLHCITQWPTAEILARYQAAIVISDQLDLPPTGCPTVYWQPRSLSVGIGCDRNTPATVIEQALATCLSQHQLAAASIQSFCSIDIKADEAGLLATATAHQRTFCTYRAETLANVKGIENPSETVLKHVGVASVAEAAALYHSGTEHLLVSKQKFAADGYNVTIAICRNKTEEPLKSARRKHWVTPKPTPVDTETINLMGSPVEPGFVCKPKPQHVDLNRPMMHYRYHLFICEGGRCAKASGREMAHEVRQIVKAMDLDSGKNRIKISRTQCLGACRYRATAVLYAADGLLDAINNGIWLQKTDLFSDADWQRIFAAITASHSVTDAVDASFLITQDVIGAQE